MSTLNHTYSVEHAILYGVDCAIIIHHLQFWIEQNMALKRNFIEGRTWMYQTQREMAACYPYWNRDKIQDILQKLVDYDVIIKGNFNRTKFDKTTWYAFKNEEMFTVNRNRTTVISKSDDQSIEIDPPIPDTNTNTKQILKQQQRARHAREAETFENAVAVSSKEEELQKQQAILMPLKEMPQEGHSLDAGRDKKDGELPIPSPSKKSAPSSKESISENVQPKQETMKPEEPDLKESFNNIEYETPGGKKKSISESEIYKHFLKFSYKTETIKEAIRIVREKNEPIGNILKLLEIICENIDNKRVNKKKAVNFEYNIPKSEVQAAHNPWKKKEGT